jgi:NTE family protein
VIVTHLCDGSFWSRHDFPDATLVEIRPQAAISRHDGFTGFLTDLLAFNDKAIPDLMEQGHADARRCLERVMKPLQARQDLRDSEAVLQGSQGRDAGADDALSDAMSRLR